MSAEEPSYLAFARSAALERFSVGPMVARELVARIDRDAERIAELERLLSAAEPGGSCQRPHAVPAPEEGHDWPPTTSGGDYVCCASGSCEVGRGRGLHD